MGGYNFEVVIKDGVGQVLHITPGMEDGMWSVGGTDDQWGASINVTHKRPSGQYVAEAQHASNPKNYEAPEIPGLDALKSAFLSMGFSPAVAEKSAMESLARMPGGVPAPEPEPAMPPGLRKPEEVQDTPGWKNKQPPMAAGDDDLPDSVPPGAKPFDYNDKSTWPEALRKSSIGPDDAPEGSPEPPIGEPRMRGDVRF